MKEIKNIKEFAELIREDKPVLVDFYADWCGPCQVMLPILDDLSRKRQGDVVIAKVNVDQNQELARQFNVRSIPSLFFIKGKEVVEHLNGVQTPVILEQKIDALSAA
ncbi:MAG: thioredoxin [Cyclobacteriaceae bacterium]